MSLVVEGEEIDIATWEIHTDFIVPEKSGSEMSYSCQRKDQLVQYEEKIPMRKECMGEEQVRDQSNICEEFEESLCRDSDLL